MKLFQIRNKRETGKTSSTLFKLIRYNREYNGKCCTFENVIEQIW